jgi:transcriptional regulator with XRE-family HTH domain
MQPTDLKKEISDWIKHIREIKGDLSQDELGKKTGIHKQQISRYERGLSHPREKQIKKIAEYGGIPLKLFIAEQHILYEAKTDRDKKILALMREILDSGDEKDVDFLLDHLEAHIKLIRASKKKDENKGGI